MIENLRIISAKNCQTWPNGIARVAIKGNLDESSTFIEEPDTIPLVYFEIRRLNSFTRIIIIDDCPYAATGMAEIFGDHILILTMSKSEESQEHAKEAIHNIQLLL